MNRNQLLLAALGILSVYLLFSKKGQRVAFGSNPNSHLTAITRGDLSTPAKVLEENELLEGDLLDFGSGKGEDAELLGADSYDPYYDDNPEVFDKKYDTITCTYVLNTITKKEADEVIDTIKDLLKPNGKAFVTVRRDVKEPGKTSRGTLQRNVKLPSTLAESIYKDSNFEIYQVRR